ncbi:MAG: TonB family protein [Flavobacteriales bacterium]|nr:TonB family protein [Flavobacteriales bacterium]
MRTDFLDAQMNVLMEKKGAYFSREVIPQASGFWLVELKYSNGALKMLGNYSDEKLMTEEGLFQFYYANGQPESEGYFKRGVKIGIWKRWGWDGIAKPDRIYPDDVPKDLINKVIPAEFPGGDESLTLYIEEHLNYSQDARKSGASGIVYVSFTIGITGDVSSVQVVQSINYFLDREATRMVAAMPQWKPATRNGSKVESAFILPVKFETYAVVKKED